MEKNNIIWKLRSENIIKKLQKEWITNLYLFGSYANWNEKIESDIDLLYEMNWEKMTFSRFLKLKNFLEDNLWKKIDFVDKKYLNKYYKNTILKEAKLIF